MTALAAITASLAVPLAIAAFWAAAGAPASAAGENPAPLALATTAVQAPSAGQGAEHGEEQHGAHGGLLTAIARVVNFAILTGTLVYVLRSPLVNYLRDRGMQIRHDLATAAELKAAAAAQIEEINRRMNALPGELDALRAHGAEETAAEEARILAAAAAERDRLLEQARREIEVQVRLAERELVAHAADLAVGAASDRIQRSITDDDQKRLVDRYVEELKP